ncbi:MAG: ATP-binding cassette domain-containing protein [Eisenbergiella sp.]
MSEQFLLEMQGISKRFGGVHALKNVNLQLRAGSIHALMGKTVRKSTLMKILIGMYQPDEGKILYRGKESG